MASIKGVNQLLEMSSVDRRCVEYEVLTQGRAAGSVTYFVLEEIIDTAVLLVRCTERDL